MRAYLVGRRVSQWQVIGIFWLHYKVHAHEERTLVVGRGGLSMAIGSNPCDQSLSFVHRYKRHLYSLVQVSPWQAASLLRLHSKVHAHARHLLR